MMPIMNMSLISHTDGATFSREAREAVRLFQLDGLHVEIQYSTALTDSQVMFSALILGRSEVDLDNE